MPTIKLVKDGKEIELTISQESYDEMCKAVQEPLSYKEVAKELFYAKPTYYFEGVHGNINCSKADDISCNDPCNATTRKQLESLLYLNMWLNVAEYLNKGWKPNWNNHSNDKFIVSYDYDFNRLNVSSNQFFKRCIGPWFKSKELALKSIEILGEETCKKALGIY